MKKRIDYMDEIEVLVPFLKDPNTKEKTYEWHQRPMSDSFTALPKECRRCAGVGCNTHDLRLYRTSTKHKAHAKHMHAEEAIACPRSPKE